MDIKKNLEQLDVIINQKYDTDYLKDVIRLLDAKIDFLSERIDELDTVLVEMLKEKFKNKDERL